MTDELNAREHILVWVGVWPRDRERPAEAAIAAVERTLRALPGFEELEVVGDPLSPRLDLWLRRDAPGDDDGVYLDRVSAALATFWGSDEVGVEVELGDM